MADSHQGCRPSEKGAQTSMASEHWQDEPDEQDFPAAESYLSLLVGHAVAGTLVAALRGAGDA